MKIKKLNLQVSFGIDPEFDAALNAATLSKRMTKTGYIRDTLLTDLVERGFMKPKTRGDAR